MSKRSKKCEKEEQKQKSLLKKAIQQNNVETSRLYATGAIRKSKESVNYLKLSARFDVLASYIESAMASGTMSNALKSVVSSLEKALNNDNITEICALMDNFEKHSENLNTQSNFLETSLLQSNVITPSEEIDNLIMKFADEHGLETKAMLEDLSAAKQKNEIQAETGQRTEDLSNRLNLLRNK